MKQTLGIAAAIIALWGLPAAGRTTDTSTEQTSIEQAVSISMAELQAYVLQQFKRSPNVLSVEKQGSDGLAVKYIGNQTIQVYLGNLLDQLNTSKSERVRAIDNFVTTTNSTADIPVGTTGDIAAFKESLMPVIKDEEFLRNAESITKPNKKNLDARLLKRPLVDGLFAIVAIDGAKSIRFVAGQDVTKYHISEKEFFDTAIANLTAKSSTAQFEAIGSLQAITLDGTYEVSLLLVPDFWTRVEQAVGGDFVVAIPARGALFVAPANDVAAVATLRAAARNLKLAYPLTQKLLRKTASGWAYLED